MTPIHRRQSDPVEAPDQLGDAVARASAGGPCGLCLRGAIRDRAPRCRARDAVGTVAPGPADPL